VDARRKTAIRLSEDAREGFARVAAKGNFNKNQGQAPPFGGEDGQTFPPKGGGSPFGTTNAKRQIPDDHNFDKKAIKPIVKSLWAMSVALGHALTAHRQFSRLKSSTFSPDGLLGGRGYVMPVKEVRQALFDACENLSALVDTLHDEINAPHWKPKLADLEKADMAEVERLLSDAEEWVDNPEEEVEEEQEEVEGKGGNNSAWTKEKHKKDTSVPRSDLPGGGDKETVQKSGPSPASPDHPQNKQQKQSSAYTYDRQAASPPSFFDREIPLSALALPKEARDLRELYVRFYQANSSVDPGTLPGPRVDHLDRADQDQTGPGGSYNREDEPVGDSWGETDGVSGEPMSQNTGDSYNYPSAFDGEFNNTASSGEDAAKYDFRPSRDIYNPHAVLPNDPEAPLGDRAKGKEHYETIEDKQVDNYDRTSGYTNPYQNSAPSPPTPWTNPESPKAAASGVPDSNSDSTPGQAFDFGIGDGNGNDAHGQAAGGYGLSNPGSPDSNPDGGTGNRGVYGPRADLPNDPGGATRDREHGDSNPMVEQGIGNNSVPTQKAAEFDSSAFTLADFTEEATENYQREGAGELPNDDQGPVARSDYYWGDKGNDFNFDKNRAASPTEQAQSRQPGNNAPQPPAPMKSRPMSLQSWEFSADAPPDPMATSGMPGDNPGGTYDSEPGYGVDEYHRTEQVDQPYITYDDNTHNMKPDETYQRGDLPAPYVNQTTP
jgi:hypothetical protein